MSTNSGLSSAFQQSKECLICAEVISSQRLRSSGSCDHDAVCSICFLRLRTLLRDFSCPICKKSLDQVICFEYNESKFSSYTIWGDDAGPSLTFDHKSRIFFPKFYYEQRILPLWQCKCLCCEVVKKDVKTLRSHLNADHNIRMCMLCIENKQVFPSEQKTYTPSQYEVHLQKGDGDGSDGHPQCKFCQIRHYDKTSLFIHLKKDHYSCHICERDGIKYRYYENYRSLEVHFETSHFPCTESSCIEKRFVVFSNEIDLRAHTLQTHPSVSINRTIPIHFKLRRNRGGVVNDNNDEMPDNYRNNQMGFSSRDESSFERKPAQGDTSNSGAQDRFDAGISGRVRNNGEWQIEFPAMLSSSSSSSVVTGLDTGVPRSTSSNSNSSAIATWVGSGWNATPVVEEYPALQGSASSSASSGLGRIATSKAKVQTTKKGGGGGGKGSISSFRDAVNPPLPLAVMLHRGLAPPPPPPARTVAATSSASTVVQVPSYPIQVKSSKSKSVPATAKDFPPLSSSSSPDLPSPSSPTTPTPSSTNKPAKQSVPSASHVSTILQSSGSSISSSGGNAAATSKSKKKITVKGLSVVKPDVPKPSQGTTTAGTTNRDEGRAAGSPEPPDPFAGYKLLRNDIDSSVSWGGREGITGGGSDYVIRKTSSDNNTMTTTSPATATAAGSSSMKPSLSLPLPPPPGFQPLPSPQSSHTYPDSSINSSSNSSSSKNTNEKMTSSSCYVSGAVVGSSNGGGGGGGWVKAGGSGSGKGYNILSEQSIKQLSLDDSDYPALAPSAPSSTSSISDTAGIQSTANNMVITKNGVKSVSAFRSDSSELKAPVTSSSISSKKNGKKTKIKNELINLAFQMKK